jgi:hypothetical protein
MVDQIVVVFFIKNVIEVKVRIEPRNRVAADQDQRIVRDVNDLDQEIRKASMKSNMSTIQIIGMAPNRVNTIKNINLFQIC